MRQKDNSLDAIVLPFSMVILYQAQIVKSTFCEFYVISVQIYSVQRYKCNRFMNYIYIKLAKIGLWHNNPGTYPRQKHNYNQRVYNFII